MDSLTEVESLTRDQVVPYYKGLILTNAPDDEIKRVNKLILSKWTSSGLNYIKEKAWAAFYIQKQESDFTIGYNKAIDDVLMIMCINPYHTDQTQAEIYGQAVKDKCHEIQRMRK